MKKYQNIFYQDETVKRVFKNFTTNFTTFPMVSYRNVRMLCSYLVRAKLYPLSVGVADVRCVAILKKLKHFQEQSQGKL